ncbi:MAG TPA: hypothetical protein VFZ01_11605 [Geminicoccaceae bacterium]
MVDRTPQQFANGTPDGLTDNTAAIQAAIDLWQPGDQVVLSGGQFRVTAPLAITSPGLVLRGDAAVKAKSGFAGSVMLGVAAPGVVIDGDGLLLDQADVIVSGASVVAAGAVGLEVRNLVSRGTQQAFVRIDSGTIDLLVQGCDHEGKGYGIVSFDAAGLARLTFRSNRFVHPGLGTAGDGLQLNCPTFGASEVVVVDCTASGYIGEATDQGMGFGFARVTDGRIIGCRAEGCEGDAFHFEHLSHRWLCADLRATDIGVPTSTGNGSGLIAYDSDDLTVVLMLARNCAFHGIALSGQGKDGLIPEQHRLRGRVERCEVDTTRRDGIHMTAQRDFRIDRNLVRDPSQGNPGTYAGIHLARQGGATLENINGHGTGNTVILSGATAPQGEIVVRAGSVDCFIDGVSGGGITGEPFADGTLFTDGTGWLEAA